MSRFKDSEQDGCKEGRMEEIKESKLRSKGKEENMTRRSNNTDEDKQDQRRSSRGSGCICQFNPLLLAAPLCAVRISLLSELQQVGEQGAALAPAAQRGGSDDGHICPPWVPLLPTSVLEFIDKDARTVLFARSAALHHQ